MAQVQTQVPYVTDWLDGFESGWGLWTTEVFQQGSSPTNWEMGNPMGAGPGTAYSGSNCTGTNLWDWYYPFNADITLMTPWVELGTGPQILNFQTWYNMWAGWCNGGPDGGFVEINNGTGWTQINPLDGYPDWGRFGGYNTGGFTGDSDGWEFYEFDISAYASQVVQIRFHFATESCRWLWGWYLDDVYMGSPPPYKCELAPEFQSGYGDPGTYVGYLLTLTNTGANVDIYDLYYNSTWPVEFYDIWWNHIWSVGPVPVGTGMDFYAVVSIPGGAMPGDFDIADIYAVSWNDWSVWDMAQVRSEVLYIASVPWFDDMESGAPGWETEGLWHMVTDGVSPYPNSYSPTHSWWYGQDSTGDYDTGTTNSGRLATPWIDLTGVSDAELTFWEWYQTEGFMAWDQRWVQIDIGFGWQNIIQLNESAMSTWQGRVIDLTPYCGNFIRLGFRFDTVDGAVNNFRGWYIDDVRVESSVDLVPPVASNEYPAHGSRINDPSPTVSVEITDNVQVDMSTVKLYINGFNVFSDKTPIPGGYRVSYDHEGMFSDGQVVTCRIVARDVDGNLLDWTWTFTVDLSNPFVVSVSPPDGSEGVSLTSTIEVEFSEPMDQLSAESAFSIFPPTPGSFAWNGTTMIFIPDMPLMFNTYYGCGINWLALDLAGNNLAGDFWWIFYTGDTSPPEHSNEFPGTDGYTSDLTPMISVHVTDAAGIDASSVRLYVQGFRVDCAITPIPGGYNISYWHEFGFSPGDTVTCRIVAYDLCGNLLDFTWQFTVGAGNSFNIPLHAGWNLVSIPLVQTNTSILSVLSSIAGQWSVVKYYDTTDAADHWKTYRPGSSANDLWNIDHTMGFWIYANVNTTLTVYGETPTNTGILLRAGWNLVGYPTLNTTTTLANALFGTGYLSAEGYCPVSPYIMALDNSYIMQPGEGYWVYVPADAMWAVSYCMPPSDDTINAEGGSSENRGTGAASIHESESSGLLIPINIDDLSSSDCFDIPMARTTSGGLTLFALAMLLAMVCLAIRRYRRY
jgi:hypothetical protein